MKTTTPLQPLTLGKLFVTGFTVGPIVDSLHNQCLLQYDILPISIEWPTEWITTYTDNNIPLLFGNTENHPPYLFCSSWTVPPLLGIAYVVLGAILPRIVESIVGKIKTMSSPSTSPSVPSSSLLLFENPQKQNNQQELQSRALLAVITTAMIIKLSEYLETTTQLTSTILSGNGDHFNILILLVAAIMQWAILDGSIVALLVATVTSIGGPLSEIPFVANHVWEYLPQAADYFPLQIFSPNVGILEWILKPNYKDLALSSITGPCYFAVAMDAMALGRYFDSNDKDVNM